MDGAADVEIRGDSGIIRNINGQRAEWRRFECSSPLPSNPVEFRFAGVDGRGRQQLIRDPRNGGVAVVRIEDPQGGREGYTFDLTWGGGYPGGYSQGPAYPPPSGPGGFRRFTTEQAVNACQDAVRDQARSRFGGRGIEFREVRMDDNPGRNDWVIGFIDVLRGGPEEHMRFSCSVDFGSGRVRSVDLQPLERGYGGPGRRFTAQQAVSACQDAVRDEARTRFRGRAVEFREVRMDDNPGRNDWVVGFIDVVRGGPEEHLRFSCSVNFDTGRVRSVDLRPMDDRYRR